MTCAERVLYYQYVILLLWCWAYLHNSEMVKILLIND